MAGHNEFKGNLFLPRSGLEPPEIVTRQIFSFIEETESTLCIFFFDQGESILNFPTLKCFFALLKNLRIIICQDAAVMLKQNVPHVILSLPV